MHTYWVTRNQESKENHGFELLYYIHKKEWATMTTSDPIHPKLPPSVGVATRKVGLSPVTEMPFSFGVGGKTFLKRHCQQLS